jgi:plasmid stability protein
MQNACMASVTIRNVPEATRDELAARAARSGRSLQEYLRHALVELAERPDPASLIDRVALRKRATGTELSADQIVRWLDEDRR